MFRWSRDEVLFWAAFAVCTVASVVPIWLVKYLPMTDLPQHLLQVVWWERMSDPGFPYADYFELNWFNPYYGAYLPARLLLPLMSAPAAMNVVLSGSVVGLPLSMYYLFKRTGRPGWLALLGFPLAFGYCFSQGMVNFILATPIAVLAVTQILLYDERPTRWRWLAVGLLSVLLVFIHMLAYPLPVLVAGLLALRHIRDIKAFLARLSPALIPVPLILLMFWINRTGENGLELPFRYDWGLFRLVQFPAVVMGEVAFPGVLTTTFGTIVFLGPVVLGFVPDWRGRAFVACLAAVLLYFFMPNLLFAFFLYPRFAVFAAVFYLASLTRAHRTPSWIGLVVVLVVVLVWMGITTRRFVAYDQEARLLDPVLDATVPGKRLRASILFAERQSALALGGSPNAHLPGWYAIRDGNGFFDPSFAYSQPVIVRFRDIAAMRRVWLEEHTFPDYYVCLAPGDPLAAGLIDAEAAKQYNMVLRSGKWWLYEKNEGGADR